MVHSWKYLIPLIEDVVQRSAKALTVSREEVEETGTAKLEARSVRSVRSVIAPHFYTLHQDFVGNLALCQAALRSLSQGFHPIRVFRYSCFWQLAALIESPLFLLPGTQTQQKRPSFSSNMVTCFHKFASNSTNRKALFWGQTFDESDRSPLEYALRTQMKFSSICN